MLATGNEPGTCYLLRRGGDGRSDCVRMTSSAETVGSSGSSAPPSRSGDGAGRGVDLRRARQLAAKWRWTAFALLVERAGAPLAALAGVVALFVTASWLGLFAYLGPVARMGVTGLFLVVMVAAALPLLRIRWPQESEIRARLDASRPEAHRPLAALADRPVAANDPLALALWQAHRDRAHDALDRLQAHSGDARLRETDPRALRAAVLLALVASAFVAGDERPQRLAQAFDWTTPRVPPVPPRLDVWIDPPAYTGRPPIFLTGAVTIAPDEVIRAPVGSILTIRSTRPVDSAADPSSPLSLVPDVGLTEPKAPAASGGEAPAKPAADRPGVQTIRRQLNADATAEIQRDGQRLARYRFAVIPDLKPTVVLKSAMAEQGSRERQQPAGLRLTYALGDDYGIAKAELGITPVRKAGERGKRTLYPPPAATIPLRLGDGDLLIATEDHPWAGLEVEVRLIVEDDIGQMAESETRRVVLPRRPFSQPLARALVEQRGKLVVNPDDRQDVAYGFAALLFAPEIFTPNIGEFLALDTLRQGLRTARSDERLREIADQIYDYALYIENGDMTEAERRLREAEARLREALERGATQQEIKRLAEELRRAMDEFLREFAERALREQDRAETDREPNPADRMLTQRDLQDMLRKIEEKGGLEDAYPYPIGLWTLGGAVEFFHLGGEVVVDYALRLKRERRGPATWVAGYAHDVMAYIPSRRVLAEGGYEGGGA